MRKGEILGVAGLMGAGRTDIMKAIFGYEPLDSGQIFINGQEVKIDSPIDAIRQRIAFITEDRKSEGLVLDFSIRENLALTNLESLSKGSVVSNELEQQFTADMMKLLNVKASSGEQAVKSLSGGNQQKVVIAKWLGIYPQLLILDEPTRGVDVGAKKEIYSIMNKLTEEGDAVIMVSSELPEVLGMSDRVLVIHEGKVGGILEKDEASQESIMALATGGRVRMAKKGNVLQQLGSLIGLALIIVVITALNPAFIEIPNLFNILRQVSINALIAFGMTFVILTGGIDLSVGSILALSSALVAGMMASGMDPFLAMAVGLLAGLVMGIVNGIIIAKGKVAPFIATLATMTIFRGLTLVYMDGRPITGLGDHLMFQMFGHVVIFLVFQYQLLQ